MQVSLQWINEFINVPNLDPLQLAQAVTTGIVEVEQVKTVGSECFEQVKVVEIQSIRPHPDSDRLNLVTFKKVDGTTMEVVCGGTNVYVGMKTPYAPVGVTLPSGITLAPKKIRGIESFGMLCSFSDLGLPSQSNDPDDHGLMDLPKDTAIGLTMSCYLNIEKDIILEIDNKGLTHRPDLWGHWGLAREMGIIWNSPLKDVYSKEWKAKLKGLWSPQNSKQKNPISVEIVNSCAVKGFTSFYIENVKVEESSQKVKTRLTNLGLRPINSIVDISNIVMMEVGYPIHIYDAHKIEGNKIFVKQIDEPCTFTTLDGVERKMLPGDTMICDSKRPLVIGGIMGGLNSGVSADTTHLFIEAANWHPSAIRQMSTRLGLRTDASSRFEKTLDSHGMETVLLRTMELILECNPQAKVVGQFDYVGEDFHKIPATIIEAKEDYISQLLGLHIPQEKIDTLLQSLGFIHQGDNNYLVPTYRATKDIQGKADIAEEIGRLIGYGHIIPKAPNASVQVVPRDFSFMQKRKIQDFWVMQGNCLEVMSYPLIGKKLLEKSAWVDLNESLKLVNAISVDHDRMRPSLIPGIFSSLCENAKHLDQFRMFELGKSYTKDSSNNIKENEQIIILYYHHKNNPLEELISHFDLFIESLGIPCEYVYDYSKNSSFTNRVLPLNWSGCYGAEYVALKSMGQFMGAMTPIHPYLLKQNKIRGSAALAVFDLSSYFDKNPKRKVHFKELDVFPPFDFDCTILCQPKDQFANILNIFKKVKIPELRWIKWVDSYTPANEPTKSMTIRFRFVDSKKTFEKNLMDELSKKVVDLLAKQGYALKSQ